jgi:hypothetical protein
MDFHEISKDGKIDVRGTWSLPMSGDVARTYLKVRCQFLEDTPFSRFSILQMGADRYNPTDSKTGAFGNSEKRLFEKTFQPRRNPGSYISEPIPLAGNDPWVSLYGDTPDLSQRIGQAQRVFVVREWKAVIDGRPVTNPSAAFFNSNLYKEDSYHAELIPPAGTKQFKAGDFIEMTVEFILLPLTREAYLGDDPVVSSLLESIPNQWKIAQAVATGNKPRITAGDALIAEGPLPVVEFAKLEQELTLKGTSALVPLTITGVPSAGSFILSGESGPMGKLTQQWRKLPNGTWECALILDPGSLPEAFFIRLDAVVD